MVFHYPKITNRDKVIHVFFLVERSKEQRAVFMSKLEKADESWPDRPQLETSFPLREVAWLRNTPAPIEAVFDICRAEYDAFIFVDQQSLQTDTAIITNFDSSSTPQDYLKVEAVRVPANRAHVLLAYFGKNHTQTPLFPGIPEDHRITEPPREPRPATPIEDANWNWPSHLPEGKLRPQHPTIISLIHLSDEEIRSLQDKIGVDANLDPVQIHNWSEDIDPASYSDLWHIFHRVNPDFVEPCDETFAFFVDCEDFAGQKRMPYPTIVRKMRDVRAPAGFIDQTREWYQTENHLRVHRYETEQTLALWKAAWNPESAEQGSEIRKNQAVSEIVSHSEPEIVGNPNIPVIIDEPLTVIFLCHATPVQIKAIRDKLVHQLDGLGDQLQLITKPGDFTNMKGVVDFFESPRFYQHQRHPWFFFAADEQTLSELENGEDVSFIAACTLSIHHDDVDDHLGYGYGRSSEISDVHATLVTANTFLWEVTMESQEGFRQVYFSDYSVGPKDVEEYDEEDELYC